MFSTELLMAISGVLMLLTVAILLYTGIKDGHII